MDDYLLLPLLPLLLPFPLLTPFISKLLLLVSFTLLYVVDMALEARLSCEDWEEKKV